MTPERRRLALQAARRAYEVRREARIPLDGPCCIYDLAEDAGVEVRFADLPSMEGIYFPAKPSILVSSLRPQGRQVFTCAHEFGHHAYGHGEQFDELVEESISSRRYDPKEFEADCFAGALLMPKSAVLKGLADRGIKPATLSPEQAYRLAGWFGVGYTALLNHMAYALHLISPQQLIPLRNMHLPAIRKMLLGFDCKQHLVTVDQSWSGRPIDAQEEDVVLLPPGIEFEGVGLELIERNDLRCLARAITPGIGRAFLPGSSWAQFTRVSRKQFVGMAQFRFVEEVEDE